MAVRQTSTLFSQLLNTGLQQKDQPVYQVIYNLITELSKVQAINTNTTEVVSGLVFLPGSIIYAGADGKITQDNANLFYDFVNKRLAIGTTAPAQTLVVQSAASGNNVIEIKRTGGTPGDWLIGLVPLSPDLIFFSSAERARLSASGVFSSGALVSNTVVNIGTNPATSGTINVPNNTTGIAARNAANTGDVGVFTVDAADVVNFGFGNITSMLFKAANGTPFFKFANLSVTTGFNLQAGILDTMLVANLANNAFGAIQALKYRAEAAGFYEFNGRTLIAASANGFLEITVNSGATGFGIQAGTDIMIVANKAQNAYGTVDAKFSAQGTAGVAAFGPAAVASITIKNGIVTAIS